MVNSELHTQIYKSILQNSDPLSGEKPAGLGHEQTSKASRCSNLIFPLILASITAILSMSSGAWPGVQSGWQLKWQKNQTNLDKVIGTYFRLKLLSDILFDAPCIRNKLFANISQEISWCQNYRFFVLAFVCFWIVPFSAIFNVYLTSLIITHAS